AGAAVPRAGIRRLPGIRRLVRGPSLPSGWRGSELVCPASRLAVIGDRVEGRGGTLLAPFPGVEAAGEAAWQVCWGPVWVFFQSRRLRVAFRPPLLITLVANSKTGTSRKPRRIPSTPEKVIWTRRPRPKRRSC